jgi:anti-sigma factor RsiW
MMPESFFQRLTTWHWGAPGDGELLALHDGELSEKRRTQIQKHLMHCPRCRDRSAQIVQDWNNFASLNSDSVPNPPSSEEAMILDIQASIRAWSEANLPFTPATKNYALTPAEAERQAIAVLGLYIGQRAAKAILQGIDASEASKQEKLAHAESTLRTLLGRKSATAVIEKLARIMGKLSEPTSSAPAP